MITESTTVYCIQDYSEYCKYEFIKGNYYNVTVHKSKYSDVRIFDDNYNTLQFYLTSALNLYLISDYFLTPQELRKEKLKKISNANKRHNRSILH